MSSEDRPGWGSDPDRESRSDWRDRDPDGRPGWRSDAESAPATGGHLPPDTASEPLYDPLTAPLPSEIAAAQSVSRADVVPRSRSEMTGRPRTGARRRVPVRRVKRTLHHVDPLSILKISMFFYACFIVVWLVFVALIYSVLDSVGLFREIENILGPEGFVASQTTVDITLFTVERWAVLLGLTFLVVGSVINVFIAFLYNVAADKVGGVEMTFVERDV